MNSQWTILRRMAPMFVLIVIAWHSEPALAQDGETKVDSSSILLKPWEGPYGGVPPWSSINTDEFLGAFDAAIEMSTNDIQQIANDPEPATFENTIVSLEDAGRALERVSTMFDVYASNLNLGPIPKIELAVMPKLAKHNDSIMQNEKLFARVAAVYQGAEMKQLNAVQQRLVDHRYKEFVRQGAKLNAADKARLSQINTTLAGLFTQFSQNVLADEEKLTPIADKSELDGLPESLVDALAAAAQEQAKSGAETAPWVVANTRSSMEPVLTYASNRALREKVWQTYYSRGDNGDEHDNNQIISQILKLRAERAKLLGYPTHAHWRLEPQMAKTPENAMRLMRRYGPRQWRASIRKSRTCRRWRTAKARHHDRAVGLSLLHGEGPQGQIRFGLQSSQAVPATGEAARGR